MDFGRVEEKLLSSVDFRLPRDPASNALVLPGKKAKDPRVWLGCAKWGRKEWIGKIYPPKTREKDFLGHYVSHYNAIELNATHYKIYGPSGIADWNRRAAGREFRFCPKMYQGVTHRGSLNGKQFLTTEFLNGVLAFGPHLGPIFVQFSESFSPNRADEMFDFLRDLPRDVSFFVEVRHPRWFAEPASLETLLAGLRELNMGIVITDTAGRRDCCHMNLTIPKTFIRFVGNSLHPTDFTRCDDWVHRMKTWLGKGIEEIYFFMHMHDEATSPELTVYLVDKLNAACQLNLIKPEFLAPAPSLWDEPAGRKVVPKKRAPKP